MPFPFKSSLVVLFFALFIGAFAQLEGQITSPGNSYVVTIQITNPTQDTIAILAWNNAFDNTTQLPVLFNVRDDHGSEVPLASTYVMRARMSSSDLFSLAAGQTYHRTVDLRQILQDLPSGPSTPLGAGLTKKVFTVALPASYRGIHGDPSAVIEGAAGKNSSHPILADLSVSNLDKVTVTSRLMNLSAVFPILGDLSSSFTSPDDGMRIDGECADEKNISDIVFDAGLYAKSLAMAASDLSSPIYPKFFPASARRKVNSIATAALKSVNGQGPYVDLYCTDNQNHCGNPNILGYSFTPSFLGNAYIVLCPPVQTFDRALPPCQTGSLGSATSSHVLLHLLLTLNNVVPAVMTQSINGPIGCQRLANSTLEDPTPNPDSLAQLAIAQWGYGLGGTPYNGPSCVPVGAVDPVVRKRAKPSGYGRLSKPKVSRSRRALYLSSEDFQAQIGLVEDCAASESSMLHIAIANAQALASYALGDLVSSSGSSVDRWTTFFNGDNHVKAQVMKTYDAVAKWFLSSANDIYSNKPASRNTTAPHVENVAFRCDPSRKSLWCRHTDGGSIRIIPLRSPSSEDFAMFIICPEYFYHAIALECINPSYIPFGLQTIGSDQGGLMLHELLHVTTLRGGKARVKDGEPACYDWNCMTLHAHDRILPGFIASNLPENTASNYEYFAYSARASRSDCSWTEFAGSVWGSIVAQHWVAAGQIAG